MALLVLISAVREGRPLLEASTRRCASLEAWWSSHGAAAAPAAAAYAVEDDDEGSPVPAAGPALAAWQRDCGAEPLGLEAVFAHSTRLLTPDRVPRNGSDSVDLAIPRASRAELGLALLRHALATEAAHARARAQAIVDGTTPNLLTVQAPRDTLLRQDLSGSPAKVLDVDAEQRTVRTARRSTSQ